MIGPGQAWRDGDIAMVSATTLAGLIGIVAAWFGASGSATPSQQVGWLNVGVAGLAISATGIGMWLQRGRRAIGGRRVALISLEVHDEAPPDVVAAHADTRAPRSATTSLELVQVAGMARVHYPECPLVAGKPLQPADLAVGELCGVCAA